MIQPPETIRTAKTRVVCDGSGDIPAALGHPRVFLEIDEKGYVECGYCDRRFVLISGPADGAASDASHDSAHGTAIGGSPSA
jgi:NADH dehydrogenase (ubiquinone) Fe-S protein 6